MKNRIFIRFFTRVYVCESTTLWQHVRNRSFARGFVVERKKMNGNIMTRLELVCEHFKHPKIHKNRHKIRSFALRHNFSSSLCSPRWTLHTFLVAIDVRFFATCVRLLCVLVELFYFHGCCRFFLCSRETVTQCRERQNRMFPMEFVGGVGGCWAGGGWMNETNALT